MARRIPGQRDQGVAEVKVQQGANPQTWDVYVTPSDDRIKEGGLDPDTDKIAPILMYQLDLQNKRVRVFPTYTRPEPDGSFTPKHKKIKAISFDWDDDFFNPNPDAYSADSVLDIQPEGLTRDPNYGLGVKKEYRFILDAIAEHTAKEVLYIGNGEPLDNEFRVLRSTFEGIVLEIDRIDRRAQVAENEVKSTTAFNAVAIEAGLSQRPFRLGRNEIRQLIQNYAADPDFRDPSAQVELVSELGKAAHTIAVRAPEATDKLVSDLQLSRLEVAISDFEALLAQNHNEDKWQEFFEADPFLLTFAFGYPISFVNGQSYVGGRRIDGKGEKIGDFLVKNSISNNAALIEIKKPQTPLLKKYRDGVFAPHDELSGGVTQVLDQRYQFVSNFAQHMKDNEWQGENALADFEIDCVLIAGTMPADKDQRRSFQLFRKNSHGVRVVTFDEMLAQLRQVLEYLKQSGM